MKRAFFFFIYISLQLSLLFAQSIPKHTLSLLVVEQDKTREPLPSALVELTDANGKPYHGITNLNGQIRFVLPPSTYHLQVSYVGYQTHRKSIVIKQNLSLTIGLQASEHQLNEVVITAAESKGLHTSSLIQKDALVHLQPTSFTDLLELLPGGVAQDPNMNAINLVRLRAAGHAGTPFDFSSLGTSFVIDGVPLSADANLQFSPGASVSSGKQQSTISRGIDMRSISTDNIESVEIVRGIPSVEYGDLTDGLIKIHRKRKESPWEARFKKDMFSQLFSIGKGLSMANHRHILNLSLDYLNSKTDPRNPLESYKRLTGSVRFSTEFPLHQSKLTWHTAIDYTGSFDDEKRDRDLDLDKKEDNFRSSYQRMNWNSTLQWKPRQARLWHSLTWTNSLSYEQDQIVQNRHVHLNSVSPIPNSTVEGEHDGIFLPSSYLAHYEVDGRPVHIFSSLKSDFSFQTGSILHKGLMGIEYQLDKNIGQGETYDPTRPINVQLSGRPRPYRHIPAIQKGSLFIENKTTFPFRKHMIQLSAGVRISSMLGMSLKYALSRKLYADPRINAKWSFPAWSIHGHDMHFSLSAGYGLHSKMPTLAQLYPTLYYYDIEAMNYYHTNPSLRRLYLMTYIWDPTHYGLKASVNRKWELHTDLDWNHHRLSITYFREHNHSGFRTHTALFPTPYKRYQTNHLAHNQLTEAPNPATLPYEEVELLTRYSQVVNGSKLEKEGIEFQYQSPRIPRIYTRITLNGAWFKTRYDIDVPIIEQPSIVLNNRAYPYYGIYQSNEGNIQERLSSNLILDTHLPSLGLTFSSSIQCQWFTSSTPLMRERTPLMYIDPKGQTFPYTVQDQQDPVKQWLVRKEISITYQSVPFAMMWNLKTTKQIGKHIQLALFVNKLLDYSPNYKRNGLIIRRSTNPYFGMEANFKL